MSEFIAGRNPVLEALKSDHPLNRVFLSKTIERHKTISEIIRLSKERGIPLEWVDRRALDKLAPALTHQGVIALTAAHKYVDAEDLLNLAKEREEPPFVILLDGIEDPQNLGAILRTADAAGAHGVVIPKRRAVGLTAAVARTSAGAIEHVKVARVSNLAQAIEFLKKEGLWIAGLEMGQEKRYDQLDYRGATGIVIGGEGKGLSRLAKEKCDFLVSIPMRGQIPSLNASVAAALIMYEVYRQRVWRG